VDKKVLQGRAGGPYSPGIVAGGFCFVAGQIGLDDDGKLADGIEEQTRRALESVKRILAQADLALADVVRTTCWLADMDDFQEMNGVYAGYFPNDPPARVTIQVARLPASAAIEIDAIAAAG
jgi:2-iminobutanoate/2-iminopropanoate deaminase